MVNVPVLLPYEITLFSNNVIPIDLIKNCFTTLWNYTILKLNAYHYTLSHCFTTLWNYTILKRQIGGCVLLCSFTTLWNYTILKRERLPKQKENSFTTLWNYTILKHIKFINSRLIVLLPYEITLFSNKTPHIRVYELFYYLMKLHYSQTI